MADLASCYGTVRDQSWDSRGWVRLIATSSPCGGFGLAKRPGVKTEPTALRHVGMDGGRRGAPDRRVREGGDPL